MATSKKLKVFRTPIGFHDAYVAAPSQKAALEAWGAGTNLFSSGAAELVSDPKLTEEALAHPGEVIRKVRGSEDEHVRALGDGIASTRAATDKDVSQKRKKRPARPSRAPVEKAEKALARAEIHHRAAAAKLKAEEDKLERRMREQERKQRDERERLSQVVDKARERHRAAMAEWAD